MDSSDDDLDIPLVFRKCYPCAPIEEKADSSDDEVLPWRTLKEKSGSPAFSLLDLDVSSDDDLDLAFNRGEKTAKPPQSFETGKKTVSLTTSPTPTLRLISGFLRKTRPAVQKIRIKAAPEKVYLGIGLWKRSTT